MTKCEICKTEMNGRAFVLNLSVDLKTDELVLQTNSDVPGMLLEIMMVEALKDIREMTGCQPISKEQVLAAHEYAMAHPEEFVKMVEDMYDSPRRTR